MNSIVPITSRTNECGYVYLAKFNLFKNCYKIGSTGNLPQRLRSLELLFGSARYMVYGFANKKITTEREIQSILRTYSNRRLISDCICNGESKEDIMRKIPIGGAISKEHFVLKDDDLQSIFSLFDSLCVSTKYPDEWGSLI